MNSRTRADLPYVLIILGATLLFVLVTTRYARADSNLPGGVTCEQVVQYASSLGIPNTWRGRAQARIIAATFGIYVTNAQLSAAAQCLKSASAVK